MLKTEIKLVFFILSTQFVALHTAFCQTKAHTRSSYAVIDPSYSTTQSIPVATIKPNTTTWIYGSAELETWRLQLLMARKDSAKLDVGYPGVYHKPYEKGVFQLKLTKPIVLKTIQFKAVGAGKLFVNDQFVAEFKETQTVQKFNFKTKKTNVVRFEITAKGNLPALLIEEGILNTTQKNWQWKSPDSDWTFVTHYPQNTQNVPPHLLENPSITLKPTVFKNNLFDFGRELFGYVVLKSIEKPVMIVGESETEALDRQNKKLEQTLEMVKSKEGVWKSKVPLAFRYVFTENKKMEDVSCEAVFTPSVYRGAFACSDTMLTKIWMNSAYTLRLCMHDFLLDGIKRDRLPWTGDLAMSMMVNSFTFGDPELVRRSLVALGRAGVAEKDINGIIDYSLWWIIAQDQYQLYYGDKEHLTKEWDRIKAALKVLSTRSDENGFLIAKKDNWLFIDWVNQDKWTALQIMWWWAQNSTIKLAERMGDKEIAIYWKNSAEKLKTNLIKTAWDDKTQVWLSSARDTAKENTRHPNFLAVISGITAPPSDSYDKYQGISKLLENDKTKPVGTPYMAGFEMMARAQLGNIDYTLQKIADYWGGMITKGATSFWEAYDPNQSGAKQYAYYGRPYAKSLCHAWSSGPAAVLPSQIVGLKPLADGWQRFTINPNLGSLKSVNVNVPTKYGDITVDIDGQDIEISIPKGTELVWKGKFFVGGQVLKETFDKQK